MLSRLALDKRAPKNPSGLGTCCPGWPKSMVLPAVVTTGTCWTSQIHPAAGCCQGIDENLVVGRIWDLVAAGQNYRKAAGEVSPAAVPVMSPAGCFLLLFQG